MTKYTIKREIEAEQWLGEGHPLPSGCYQCLPEITWSGGRKYVYFSYAEFRPRHWLGTEKLTAQPEGTPSIFTPSWVRIEKKDGTVYWREVLAFNIWSIKSEASITNNHRAVYVDETDEIQKDLLIDYVMMEAHQRSEDDQAAKLWQTFPDAQRAEYRAFDGNYGRGYRPVYMKPGDWLVKEEVRDGHDNLGKKDTVLVLSDAEFQALIT